MSNAVRQVSRRKPGRPPKMPTIPIPETAHNGRHRHCDDAIHDHTLPTCLRWWLVVNRMPASDAILAYEEGVRPVCFAELNLPGSKHHGRRVRLVMASRLGDIGVTFDLGRTEGYDLRVSVDQLMNFTKVL